MMKLSKRFTAAMLALEVAGRQLSTRERLIVQLRASFLNGCTYCIRMHSKEAHKQGESELIDILSSSQLQEPLPAREHILVRYVDMGTQLSDGFDPALQTAAREEFGEEGLAHVIQAIVTINAWNRIGVLSEK